jgi:N-acyl homoserine lactone hydrolase
MSPILSGTIKRLYILDFGLFRVHENGRVIGIPGYLLQTHDVQNILVDTGFPPAYAHDAEAQSAKDGLGAFGEVVQLTAENLPRAQLAKIGLTFADIDMLVMTHTDIDHVGGMADFAGIPIIIGAENRALPTPQYFGGRSPIDWADAEYRLISEDTALCAGVALLQSPGHAPGHLSLLLRLPETGNVVLTGDAISRPAEYETGNYGGAWDAEQAKISGERLMMIAKQKGAMIIYGHDPEQWQTLRKAPNYYG